MKKVFFILAMAFGMTMSAQTAAKAVQVPAVVTNAFTKEFPTETAVWSNQGGNFGADFKKGTTDVTVVYTPAGKQQSYAIVINQADLPEAANKYLANNFGNHKIMKTTKVKNDQGAVTYRTVVTRDSRMEVVFDQKGGFIETVKAN